MSIAKPQSTVTQPEPDDQLIQRCLNGDRQSFRQLYRRYQPRVRSLLYQLCGVYDPSGLDDLVQEVFLRAWKGLPGFRRSAQVSTWLYRIAWNVAADQRQRWHRGQTQFQVLSQHALSQQASNQTNAPDVLQLHYQDLVQRGLAHLSFEHRTVLVLHDLEELPQKDIAAILNIPVGTVKSRLSRARDGMRQFLQAQGVQV